MKKWLDRFYVSDDSFCSNSDSISEFICFTSWICSNLFWYTLYARCAPTPTPREKIPLAIPNSRWGRITSFVL